MVSSVLSPEKIVGRQNTNKAAAQNFISGGSLLGASVINGAANKIVGFQRAGVQPAAPAVDSIVSTISTNINNNVTTTINKTLQGFSADYQRRLKQVDDAKPIGILGKFLNVYKTALGFINFFGNKRNIDKVRDNLEALKKSFTESFEVAKLIRQVINKIVKQLSNLPVASPSGGGGLNLDVDIPGGGLKKSAPRGLGRMMKGKGKMLALGAGALGLGALGAGAVNALSDSPQAQAAGTSPEIPGDTVDRFSSIVDKFANAISNLFKSGKPKQQQPPGSAKGTSKPPAKPPSSADLGLTGNAPVADVSKDTEFISEVQKLSKEVGVAPSQLLSLYQAESGIDPSKATPSGYGGGIFQLMNPSAYGFTDEQWRKLSRADQVRVHRKYLANAGVKPGGKQGFENVTMANIAPSYVGQSPDAPLYKQGTSAYEGNKNIDLKYGNGDGVITSREYANFIAKTGGSKKWEQYNNGYVPPQVAAAPTKATTQQQIAQQVAQPAAAQQPVVMPINLGGGGQQQTSGGGVSGPPPSQGSGPSVPFLPAANTDNFLVLYSRMVYNIVDG